MDSWYYLLNGQQHGPVPENEMHSVAEANPGTEILVWKEGMTDWIPFGQPQQSAPATYGTPTAAPYTPYQAPGPASFQPAQLQETNGLAVTSMILGIVSILGAAFLVIPQILAIIFGHIAIGQINRSENQNGKGMAIAGLILGYLCLVFGLLMIVGWFFLLNSIEETQQNQRDLIDKRYEELQYQQEKSISPAEE